MKLQILLSAAAFGGATWLPLAVRAVPVAGPGGDPDVICSHLRNDGYEWGTVGDVSAYSIGTTACNVGDTLLSWRDSGANADQHPVIAQNLYRLRDGRFEQIGMSWVKHGHSAADDSACGPCQNANDPDWLGLGCSDTYVSWMNGQQSRLGPRSEVNPYTGQIAWPHGVPAGNSTLRGRLLVSVADMDPALNAGAVYIGEGQYVHPDEAGTGNELDNGAWRVGEIGGLSGGTWSLDFTGETHEREPAIAAWATFDETVTLVSADVPGDGRFVLGSRVSANGDGTWRYEYALFNMNAHRAARGFAVPTPAGVTISNAGFHDVHAHSGEPYATGDWPVDLADGTLAWQTADFETDPDANALRWGTLYNFRFDADTPPAAAAIAVTLFRPGAPGSIILEARGPGPADACPEDMDGSGMVGIADLIAVVEAWGTADPAADLDGSGVVDVFDLVAVILAWGDCP